MTFDRGTPVSELLARIDAEIARLQSLRAKLLGYRDAKTLPGTLTRLITSDLVVKCRKED